VIQARIRFVVAMLVAVLLAAPAVAQVAMSTGRGTVEDTDGNPLKGAVVVFQNTANETSRFETKTNKKGRFFLDNLLYSNTGRWLVTVEMDGYVPTRMVVESRTQQAVIGKLDVKLSPTTEPTEIDIRPFGTATFEFTLTPDAVWAEQNAAAEEAETVAEAGGEAGAAGVAKQRPSEDPFQAAFRLAGEGNLEGSLPFFEKAAANAPDDSELLEGWANVLYRLDRTGEASRRAAEAIAADPSRPGPYKLQFSAQASGEDWSGAAATLDAMDAAGHEPGWVLEQRATLAARAGSPDEAIAAYRALVEARPDHKEGWVALGALYADSGNAAESTAAYQKVVELDPEGAFRTFFNIGVLIRNKPDVPATENDRAIAAFRKAVEIKPDYAPAYRELAYALLARGDLAGARAALTRYLEVSPDASDAAQVRATIQALPEG
jgi:tetratricopeptide (TPR) repeat protein